MIATGITVFMGVALLMAKLSRRTLLKALKYDAAVDLTVTHPLGLSQHPINVRNAARHCQRAEAAKVQAEGDLCLRAGWGFAPMAFSPWGGIGPNARALLHEIGRRATAHLSGWPKQRCLREMHENISLTLAREVVSQLSLRNRVQDSILWEK